MEKNISLINNGKIMSVFFFVTSFELNFIYQQKHLKKKSLSGVQFGYQTDKAPYGRPPVLYGPHSTLASYYILK